MVNNDAKYWKHENFSKWAIQFLNICSRNCCSNFADNSSISFFFNNHQSLEERNYIPYYMYTIVWGKKNAFTFLPHFWCFFEMAKLNGYNSAMIKSVTNKSVVLFFNTDSTIVLQQKKKSSSSFSGAGHVSNHCWNEKISNLYSAHSRHEAGIWGKASGWRWFRDFDVKSVGMWAHGCTKVVFLAGIIYILKRFHSLHCFCLY